MRRITVLVLCLTLFSATPRAQEALTREQRIADLTQLASLYAKNYAPYEWKRDVLGFDLMRLTPWLQRIHHSDDLDFQEALIEYVASLNDAHDNIAFPTTFSASLGMTVDIYDGKVLIDSINRTRLPVAQFPFVIGDELVSLDGRPVQELIQSFRKYAISANQRSTDRIAAARLVSRSQQIMPHIVRTRRHRDGRHPPGRDRRDEHLHHSVAEKRHPDACRRGRCRVPCRGNGRMFLLDRRTGHHSRAFPAAPRRRAAIFKVADTAPPDDTLPAYMEPIHPLLNASVSKDYYRCWTSAAASRSSRCLRASPISTRLPDLHRPARRAAVLLLRDVHHRVGRAGRVPADSRPCRRRAAPSRSRSSIAR